MKHEILKNGLVGELAGIEYDNRPIFVGSGVPVGSRIKFINEKKRYTVQASNEHFAICTYPLNMIRRIGGGKYKHERTVMYSIIDWRKGIRGTENLVFGFGAETREQCEEMLERLCDENEMERTEISHRNYRRLDIEGIFDSI